MTTGRDAALASDPPDDLVRGILAASGDCIEILAADGAILFMNERGTGAQGFALGRTAVGLDFAELFPIGRERDAVRDAIRAAMRGAPTRVVASRQGGEGAGTLWETTLSAMPRPGGGPPDIVGISRDITRRSPDEGRASAQGTAPDGVGTAPGDTDRFQTIADAAPGILWTAGPAGDIDWVNGRMRGSTGLSRDALAGSGWVQAIHPDERVRVQADWAQAVSRGTPLRIEARLLGADGTERWHALHAIPLHAEDGTIQRWIGAAHDIDALKSAADALAADNEQLEQDMFTQLHEVKRTQSRLQAYFDACPDYIFLLRLTHENGLVYEDLNPAGEALYGLGRSAVVGRSPAEVDDPETAAGIAANVRLCLSTAAAVTYEAERTFAGRPPVFVQVVGAPLEYFNEEEGLVLFCGRDITEQRTVEEALRQSQKMEAVGQLTGGLAHDFNNLLTGITGSLDLLQMRVAQGRLEMVERYITAAQGAASRAAALTHRLLAFSRRQTLDPKPTDVNQLVAGMEDLLRRTAGPEIALTALAADDLWNVLVDPSQLENALLNLCINARDALPKGGRIIIETANLRLDGRVARERDLPPGDYVALSVSDDGIGMAPDIVKRIFDPFFTTKPIGAGTGLGLSMIYGFAQQSGGQVRVHSNVGIGTTMRIILPRHHGDAEIMTPPADLSDAPRARNGETVLVVDDEPTVRMLVAEVLGDLGYAVLEAVDGKAGLALLRSEARIDLLVTDVGLPGGVNGRQVAEAGRASRPGLKILFITGYAENSVLNHGHLEAGMQVITKPFAMEALASRIKLLIGDPV